MVAKPLGTLLCCPHRRLSWLFPLCTRIHLHLSLFLLTAKITGADYRGTLLRVSVFYFATVQYHHAQWHLKEPRPEVAQSSILCCVQLGKSWVLFEDPQCLDPFCFCVLQQVTLPKPSVKTSKWPVSEAVLSRWGMTSLNRSVALCILQDLCPAPETMVFFLQAPHITWVPHRSGLSSLCPSAVFLGGIFF